MEEEASSADAACAVAPFDTCTEAALIDWLAAANLAGDGPYVGNRAGQAGDHGGQRLHQNLSFAERSPTVTVRLPWAISSAARVTSFIASISVFRLFLMALKSPW